MQSDTRNVVRGANLRRLRSLAAAAVVVMAFTAATHAQSQWTNTTSGTQQWNTATNWDTNPTVPNGVGVTANLSVNLTAVQTVDLATGVTLGSLTYGDSTSGFFAQNLQGSAITFNNSGSGATLTQASTSATAPGAIANNIVLNDNLTIVNNGTSADRNNAMVLSGEISGTGRITINAGGSGAVRISNGNNTYSGGFTLNGANAKVVPYQNGDAFGTGTVTINAGIVDTSVSGGAALLLTTSNANVWNGNWTLSSFWNNNGSITLANNINVTRGSHMSLGGNISQTGGARSLTLSSAASSVFNGTNTYTGGTTVSAGSLNFLRTASMPSTGNVSFANGTTLGIGLGGDGWSSTGTGPGTLAGVFQGTNVGVGPGSSTFSYTTAVGLNLIVTGSHSFGVIENLGSGATAFTKSGLGTLTITGDNTYTGATTVQGGGGLILDYGSSDTSKFASAAALTLGGGPNANIGLYGGGTLTVKGGTFTEVVNATSLNAGHTTIARDGGTTAKLRLNAITRAAGGSISFADATIADTDRTNTNGILGGYATLGNNWAVNSTNLGDGAISALAAYDGALPSITGDATKNYTLSGNLALTGPTAANTVKITNTGISETLSLGANNLTITSISATTLGGIMYAGGADGNYAITGTGRIQASSGSNELIFAVNTGTLTVSAIIGGSGTNSPLTKTGAGTLVISSAYTGNGNMYINEGVLRLNNAAASGAATNFGGLGTFVQNGAAIELGGFTFTDGERLMLTGSGISNGGALRAVSGTNTWRGLIEIGLGGARINNDSASLLTIGNGVTTVSGGDITFGGAGNTTVTARTNTSFGSHAINGGGGLIKDGVGTLTLSGRNNYVGVTTVNAGVLLLGHATNTLFDTGAVTVNGGTLNVDNPDTVGVVTLVSGLISGDSALTGSSYDVRSGTASAALAGTGVALTKTTSGTVILSGANTYTGATAINGGILLINGDNSGATGAVTVAVGATLGGTGTVGGLTTVLGTHAPGTSPGIQTFASGLSYSTGSDLTWELISNATAVRGTDFDGINVTGGTLSIASGVISKLVFNGSTSNVDWTAVFWDSDQTWLVYDNLNLPMLSSSSIFDTINVTVDSLGQNFSLTGGAFSWRQDGNDVFLDYTAPSVFIPEPGSVALLGLGLMLIGGRRRA